MSSIIESFKQQLHKNANPLEDPIAAVLEQEKNTTVPGADKFDLNAPPPERKSKVEAPAADQKPVKEEEPESPYTEPIKHDEPEGDKATGPFTVNPDKTINWSRQSEKMVLTVDALLAEVLAFIADEDESKDFKITEEEKKEILLFLPDIAEKHGITMSDELGLTVVLIKIYFGKGKLAFKLRKQKAENDLLRAENEKLKREKEAA
jgi:hypothetical protein